MCVPDAESNIQYTYERVRIVRTASRHPLDIACARAEGGAMPDNPPLDHHVLHPATWRARARTHVERVRRWTVPHRERSSRGERHPVYDFLFQYYT